jgi:hypothetical protein
MGTLAGTAGIETGRPVQAVPGGSAEGKARKLAQIKDLYMTVEAIGDENVDKHFDELLQRQRELISDYFRETGIGAGKSAVGGGEPGPEAP